MNEFVEFVKNELGDIAVPGSKKIGAYLFCWTWGPEHSSADKMIQHLADCYPDHSTYEFISVKSNGTEVVTQFAIDRTKQYERIYNHRKN